MKILNICIYIPRCVFWNTNFNAWPTESFLCMKSWDTILAFNQLWKLVVDSAWWKHWKRSKWDPLRNSRECLFCRGWLFADFFFECYIFENYSRKEAATVRNWNASKAIVPSCPEGAVKSHPFSKVSQNNSSRTTRHHKF